MRFEKKEDKWIDSQVKTQLYINAHCYAGSDDIQTLDREANIHFTNLAIQIAAGIGFRAKDNPLYINLLICEGASNSAAYKSFAEKLLLALRECGVYAIIKASSTSVALDLDDGSYETTQFEFWDISNKLSSLSKRLKKLMQEIALFNNLLENVAIDAEEKIAARTDIEKSKYKDDASQEFKLELEKMISDDLIQKLSKILENINKLNAMLPPKQQENLIKFSKLIDLKNSEEIFKYPTKT